MKRQEDNTRERAVRAVEDELERDHGGHVRVSEFVDAEQQPAPIARRVVKALASCPFCRVDMLFAAAASGEPPLELLHRVVAAAGIAAPAQHISAADWAAVATGRIDLDQAIPLVAHVTGCRGCTEVFVQRVEEGEQNIAWQADNAMGAAFHRMGTSPRKLQRSSRAPDPAARGRTSRR